MKHTATKAFMIALAFLPAVSQAQQNMAMTQSIPALDEIGLIGLVALVGAVAGWVIKRHGK
jgi:ABC-type iron transport system FetAB permease component